MATRQTAHAALLPVELERPNRDLRLVREELVDYVSRSLTTLLETAGKDVDLGALEVRIRRSSDGRLVVVSKVRDEEAL